MSAVSHTAAPAPERLTSAPEHRPQREKWGLFCLKCGVRYPCLMAHKRVVLRPLAPREMVSR